MNAPGLVVIARWRLNDRDIGEALRFSAELRRHSLAEPGCLEFEIFRNAAEPGALLLVERYADDAALDSHRSSRRYRELVVERIIPLLTDRRVELLKPLTPS